MSKNNSVVMPALSLTLIISFLWSYWPNLIDLINVWQTSDEYSSGMLVPFMAGYVLYHRKNSESTLGYPIFWPALFGLLLSEIIRIAGIILLSAFLTRIGVLFAICSLLLLLLGKDFCKKNYSVFLFLILMIPLPHSIHGTVSPKLQEWATHSAVFILEMIGYSVVNEGNIIYIGNTSVAVAEACNGLRMITAFFVTTGLIALIINKETWQKVVIVASTLPVALISNTIRLVVTSIAFTQIEGDDWEKLFHDFGGFAMMPIAIVIIIGELAFMNMLVDTDKDNEDHTIVLNKAN